MSPSNGPPRGGHLPGEPRPARRASTAGEPSDGGEPPLADLPRWARWLLLVGSVLAVGFLLFGSFPPGDVEDLTYSQFLDRVERGHVERITIGPEGDVEGELQEGGRFTTVVPAALDHDQLTATLRDKGVQMDARTTSPGVWGVVLGLLPFVLIVAAFVWLGRRARGQFSQLRGMTRSQADVITTERPDTGFDDVAGYGALKREVREVVDYLRDPERYRRAGARGPKGVLLIGPPGTGKTLLARAVAGEADVPFISVEGSSFVQMLVGVGASRVRDLFAQARKLSPSIIFIDELDSVGRKRGGVATIGANNEQEQTLNQLLAEMDGFEPAEGVVVIAATNRPQLLDEALLRPGRFDRRLMVALPRRHDRLAILQIHTANKRLADDADLDAVARATPGFSGADLENLANEAAITAVRDGREVLTADDFDRARTRIMLGRREESNVLSEDEQHRVAVHESGHAIVAALSEPSDPVAKVTILPTGRALGATEQLPVDERRLHTEQYLVDTLAVRLGGRAAELLVLGQGSTGAANDLREATEIAARMVRDFGLSEKLGPVGYAEHPGLTLGDDGERRTGPFSRRPFAEATQRLIDEEVARLLREAEKRALEDLEQHRDALEALVQRLLEEETVDGAEVHRLVGRPVPPA
ncbi:MAG TPA: ATP-dependent zinc metalloprotease FtsH [Nitriliruptorales bacterium]|nr:ATP-dependent zinc metalloprotease FtsH [Nitriliruptorales bacterium]